LETLVRVLDVDPAFAAGMPEERRELARQLVVATAVELPAGPLPPLHSVGDHLGALVVRGLLSCTSAIGSLQTTELLGPGDVLWCGDGEPDALSEVIRASWQSHEGGAVLAMIEGEGARAAMRFPELVAALAERLARRSDVLLRQALISNIRRLDVAVELVLWLLAERYGRVGTQGVRLDLPLTHRLIAELLGAHRSSVTVALSRLTATGRVHRDKAGRFLLLGSPPLAEADDLPASLAVRV
jgi:CRP/FNR family cyclic AMP-dependent transcriptional regulator